MLSISAQQNKIKRYEKQTVTIN
jgi:hypothetical protein